jgi:hypothetical protein
MPKLSILFASLVILLWSACSGNKQQPTAVGNWAAKTTVTTKGRSKDTLTYTVKKIEAEAHDCAEKKEEMCSEANIEYLVFSGRPKLNAFIANKLIWICSSDDDKTTNVDSLGKNFINMYYKYKKQNPNFTNGFLLGADVSITDQNSETITLNIAQDEFTWGAHGSHMYLFINWDKKRDQSIALTDIFVDNYEGPLRKIAEGILRKQENLDARAPLSDHLLIDKFVLNNNFHISPKGVSFFYNEYEIKSYADGPTDLLIPFQSIKHLLRPNTVISQYIK